jgi:hypothetical protein
LRGLDVKNMMFGRAGASRAELRSRLSCTVEGGEQKGAETQCEDNGHRLIGGAVEIGESLSNEIGQAQNQRRTPLISPWAASQRTRSDANADAEHDSIAEIAHLDGGQAHDSPRGAGSPASGGDLLDRPSPHRVAVS